MRDAVLVDQAVLVEKPVETPRSGLRVRADSVPARAGGGGQMRTER
jgi:hypothetical protein